MGGGVDATDRAGLLFMGVEAGMGVELEVDESRDRVWLPEDVMTSLKSGGLDMFICGFGLGSVFLSM